MNKAIAKKKSATPTIANYSSVAARPDGGVLMVYKAVATKGKPPFGGPVSHLVATSDSPTGPFRNPILPADYSDLDAIRAGPDFPPRAKPSGG